LVQDLPGTQATYVFGNGLDEVLNMDRGGQSFYYHTNALGTIVALTDSTGNAVEAYQYDAYGYQTIILPGPNGVIDYGGDDIYLPGGKSSYDNPFLFTAQRYDPSSGLMYYKNRYYSSALGRFMSRDPIGIWGDPVELGNGYAYVGDNPTNLTDSTGNGTYNTTKSNIKVDPGGPPPPPPPLPPCIEIYGPTCRPPIAPPGGPSSENIIIIEDWGWLALSPMPAPSAVNAYLVVADRPGPSTSKKDAIDILSFSFGSTQQHVIGPGSSGGESRAGRADISNVTVMKVLDKTSPLLFDDCVTGNYLTSVDVIYDKPMGDSQEDYFKIHMENAMITSIQLSGSAENPTESISFALKLSYNPEEGGKLKGFIDKGFDLLQLKPW
jgi:type VI secretion system Hcp family effector